MHPSVKPVLTKTQRYIARELAYRLLERGVCLPVCFLLICALWRAAPLEVRMLLAHMAKPGVNYGAAV